MENTKTYRFEASHILPKHPGKCSRLHGHSWVLKVSVEGDVNPDTGFVMDYADISAAVKPLIEKLDHNHLGTWASGPGVVHQRGPHWNPQYAVLHEDFYPSSENLILWIAEQLDKELEWSKLELQETCTSSCVLTREDYERTVRLRSRNVEASK